MPTPPSSSAASTAPTSLAAQSPKTFASLADGRHTVSFRAVDAAGNADPTPAQRRFTVDTTAPDTAIDQGPTGGIATHTATFRFSGSPAADTTKLQCSLDGASFTECSSPKTFALLPDGAHTVSFRAVDAAGNAVPTPAQRRFTVDTTPPDTSIDSGPSGAITTADAGFAFSGSPAMPIPPSSSAASTARLLGMLRARRPSARSPTAAHTVSFRAVDAAGNADPTPAQRSFTVDTTPPDTSIESGPSGTITTADADFAFSGTPHADTAELQCSLDGADFSECQSPKTFALLPDGAHTVSFRAVDAAGNADPTPAQRSFTVDTTPPDTQIDSGPSGTIATDAASFRFSGRPASDAGRLECSIDGSTFAACGSPKQFTALSDGFHRVSFRAIDAVGNADATPAARGFTVDTTAPTTTITRKPRRRIKTRMRTAKLWVAFSSDSAGTFECRLDRRKPEPCSSAYKTRAKAKRGSGKKHRISIVATDQAGNVGEPVTARFKVVRMRSGRAR